MRCVSAQSPVDAPPTNARQRRYRASGLERSVDPDEVRNVDALIVLAPAKTLWAVEPIGMGGQTWTHMPSSSEGAVSMARLTNPPVGFVTLRTSMVKVASTSSPSSMVSEVSCGTENTPAFAPIAVALALIVVHPAR